jgi:hypothetical protein
MATGRLIRSSEAEAETGWHHKEQLKPPRLRKQKQTKQKQKRLEEEERFGTKPNE